MDFFSYNEGSERKEYLWKVLVYPNITYAEDLEKDSFILVLKSVIDYLNEWHDDKKIHFTVLVPRHVTSLERPNVTQKIFPLPTYPNSMRIHFDFNQIKNTIDGLEEDYDIVYSHLPEHTLQLKNYFNNATNIDPRFIGYLHWIEVPENTGYGADTVPFNLFGMLQMDECGVNSVWLKNLILKHAAKIVSTDNVLKLQKIIQPHYLGIDKCVVPKERKPEKIVMFNHRPNHYTGWSWFEETVKEIWEKRQDFKVVTTMAESSHPAFEKLSFQSRKDYLTYLSTKVKFGVGTFVDYSAWSLSAMDGLSHSVPYLLPNDFCYPEMVGEYYPYLYENKEDFVKKFNEMLDGNPKFSANDVSKFLSANAVGNWFDGWKNVFEPTTTIKNSESYEILVDIIKKNKFISKKDLLKEIGWGRGIRWTPYRNKLRTDKRIRFTQLGYEFVE